jgi:hypothetical protein
LRKKVFGDLAPQWLVGVAKRRAKSEGRRLKNLARMNIARDERGLKFIQSPSHSIRIKRDILVIRGGDGLE